MNRGAEREAYLKQEMECHLVDRAFTRYRPSRDMRDQDIPCRGMMNSEEWRQCLMHRASTILQVNDLKRFVSSSCPKCTFQGNEVKHLYATRQ